MEDWNLRKPAISTVSSQNLCKPNLPFVSWGVGEYFSAIDWFQARVLAGFPITVQGWQQSERLMCHLGITVKIVLPPERVLAFSTVNHTENTGLHCVCCMVQGPILRVFPLALSYDYRQITAQRKVVQWQEQDISSGPVLWSWLFSFSQFGWYKGVSNIK